MTVSLPPTPPPNQTEPRKEWRDWFQAIYLYISSNLSSAINSSIATLTNSLSSHVSNVSNPHQTTKAQVLASNLIVNADVSASASIDWSKISKTGSSLADLTTRAASDLVVTPSGNLSATTGQAAFSELQTDVDGRVQKSGDAMTGNLSFAVGFSPRLTEGSNALMGTATLSSGTVVVNNTAVTANSRIFLTAQNAGSAQGSLYISARVAATSFTISSTSGTDDRLVAYLIMEPV